MSFPSCSEAGSECSTSLPARYAGYPARHSRQTDRGDVRATARVSNAGLIGLELRSPKVRWRLLFEKRS